MPKLSGELVVGGFVKLQCAVALSIVAGTLPFQALAFIGKPWNFLGIFSNVLGLVALAAVIGHCWPVVRRFEFDGERLRYRLLGRWKEHTCRASDVTEIVELGPSGEPTSWLVAQARGPRFSLAVRELSESHELVE